MKKLMSLVLAMLLLLAAGCGAPADDADAPVTVADGDTVGEGAVSFPLLIADKDGNEVNITVNTDADTVGAALLELGLIAGDESEYGLYVKTVNGITADYDTDGTYWAFYINGEYAMTGVDATPITDGESYALNVE